MKRKVIIALLIISIVALSSTISYAAFTKKIEFNFQIDTADMGYCKNNQVGSFMECLVSASQQNDYTSALDSMPALEASSAGLSIEPQTVYKMRTATYNRESDDNTGYTSSTVLNFTYVEETTKIDVDEFNETGILPTENISFNTSTGYFTFTDTTKVKTAEQVSDILTDKNSNTIKYTCFNGTSNGNCTTLYIIYRTKAHSTTGATVIKEMESFYYLSVEPSTSQAGLFKVADEYTTDTDNDGELDSNFSYVYRGNIKNNWVEYAGSLWRIVRINGNGTIRMIYSGDASSSDPARHTGSYASILMQTATGTARTSSFAPILEKLGRINYNTATSVGYMYNPSYKLATSPSEPLKSPSNPTARSLFYVGSNTNFGGTTKYYFFNEFALEENCSLETETCTFTTKCETDEETGVETCNYVHSTWNDLVNARDENENPINYTDDPAYGYYTNANGSTQYYYYTNPYKYVCNTNIGTTTNPDGTITIDCLLALEVLGAVKSGDRANSTTARVRYHGIYSNNAEDAYSNVEDSKIKIELENWYENNILNTEDEDYLSDEGFCADRSYNTASSNGVTFETRSSVIFGAYTRNTGNARQPSLVCPNKERDLFTTASSSKGNKMSKYPIGLITIDEAAFAGGRNGSMNQNYYLYTGQTYWTMSPYSFSASSGYSSVWVVNSAGTLSTTNPSNAYGVRPVVNLRSDVLFVDGDGTESNPYQIELHEDEN